VHPAGRKLRFVTPITNTPASTGTDELLELLAHTARGPRRDGVFALWLVVRVADGLGSATAATERAERRRLANLERRLASLTLPPPLRRALVASLALLREPDPGAPGLALGQLVAPVRESIGADAAAALDHASRELRRRERN
jgi:phytoene/squalene synthetase